MPELDAEDAKLVTLARSARARSSAAQAAAVRDTDGRTYVASSVALPSLRLSALQVAVAMAVSSGAPGLEAAVVLGDGARDGVGDGARDDARDGAGEAAVRDVAPDAAVYYAASDGTLR
jgi:hypothetical protein